MIVRFIMALVVWVIVGVLVAAMGSVQVPPDYSLTVSYGVLFLAWTVSYWIRARSDTPRRWWWLGGVPELVLLAFERRRPLSRQRTYGGAQPPGNEAAPPTTRSGPPEGLTREPRP
ncbi:hypothetical protein AB0L00_24075 [Actinoallomurus sp. NPDC052308]|uniref:hypothetical protein n=1 Tax=Actinoallomurus sp. NPDC052308 TaxID=3155530 RepID=UPI003418A6A7